MSAVVEPGLPAGFAPELALNEAMIARKVLAERVRVFVDRSVAGALSSPLGTVLLAWLLGPVAGWGHAAAWLCLINLVELLILGVGYRYREVSPREEAAARWAWAMVLGNFLAGLAWGSSVWFFWVDGEFKYYLLNLTILVGVSAICVNIMSPIRIAMLLFSAGVLLPPMVHLVAVGNPYGVEIATGLATLFVVQLHYARIAGQQLIHGLDSFQRSLVLVENLSQVRGELFQSNCELESRNAELNSALARLEVTATHDELTGAFNRRYIVEQLERQAAHKARHGAAASIIMFDLDHFKRINDRYGHPVGDQALQETVRAVATALREGDVLARYGGEEFLVLSPMADCGAACQLAGRLRTALAAIQLTDGRDEIFVRASFGVAELAAGESVATWLRRVDMALYQAKEQGRDRVVMAG